MKAFLVVVLLIFTGILLTGCKKKDDAPRFIIKINDTAWPLQEISVKGVYYPKFQHLFISASDGTKWFYLGVNVNAASPLTSYVFEPNGNNAASIQISNDPGYYISDNNVVDAGGNFSLTAFDTVQKKLSCKFLLNCYSGDRVNKKILAATLSDVSFSIDTLSDPGNSMSCTVIGAKTTNWETKVWGSLVNCNKLDLEFHTMGGYFRALWFSIPFSMGIGTYPIFPYTLPYIKCDQNYITAKYEIDSTYFPTSGSITITKLDVAQRKMQASFSLNVKDNRGDRIQITNGNFTLNTWKDKP